MANTLRNLGFTSTKADPDVWIRAGCKTNGDKIYEYVLCYVDNIQYGGLDPKTFMKRLSDTNKFEDGSVKEPDTYLGADISKYTVHHDGIETECYSMSSDKYLLTICNLLLSGAIFMRCTSVVHRSRLGMTGSAIFMR